MSALFSAKKRPDTNFLATEKLAADWGVRLEAVQEAIAYGQGNPPELLEDHQKDQALAEAIGMNDPAIRHSGRPRSLPTDERARLGL